VLGTVALALFTAVIFCLFWVGVASIVLGSTLFVTFGLAALGWLWLAGTYLAANLVYGLVTGARNNAGQTARLKTEEKWASIHSKGTATEDGDKSVVKRETIDDGVELGAEQFDHGENSASSG
jgi:hypothetical protein